MKRSLENIFERQLFAEVLTTTFKEISRLSSIEWGREKRTITSTETSFAVGSFEPLTLTYLEYVYDCLDNPYIPVINCQKPARVGWTEAVNTWLGNGIENKPTNNLVGFPTTKATKDFALLKWKPYVANTPAIRDIINVGVAKNKESMFTFLFPGGSMMFTTLGSIASVKSNNIPRIVIEEPDDAPDNVKNQGSLLKNLEQRQKTVPRTQRKIVFGGTPTNKDFSRVEEAIKLTNQMVFKAQCHCCKELIPLTGEILLSQLKYEEYQDRYIDEIYGKFNPESAYFECPECKEEWTFQDKTNNILTGKQFGFVDHTGNFSKGWHPTKPEITDKFGFLLSELLSTMEDGSGYVELAKDKILADKAAARGDEKELKSYYNNRAGLSYASGISAMTAEDMKKLRSNYPEGVMPYEALVPFIGIDVQHNRFAIVQIAAGRNENIWLIKWFEIFGNVFNWEDPVWQKLTDIVLEGLTHVTGKNVAFLGGSIDCQDGKTSSLVYRWVKKMNTEHNIDIKATKGSKDLKFSTDDIYQEPTEAFVTNDQKHSASLAQKLGVAVYHLGTHRCQDEVLRRIGLNALRDENGTLVPKHDVFFFNEQSYGNYEEQMTSCRKLIDTTGSVNKEVYRLVSGKHMDAMAATKNAFHSYYGARVREYTPEHWVQIEDYIHS